MKPRLRFNDHEICFVCARRACGLAVGKPAQLGWFCEGCDVDTALEAYRVAKDLDVYEERAVQKLAAKLPPEDFNFPPEELPNFLRWMIKDFGDTVKAEVGSGKAPF